MKKAYAAARELHPEIWATLDKITALLDREEKVRAQSEEKRAQEEEKRAQEEKKRAKEREADAKEFRKWREAFGSYADTEAKCLEEEFGDALMAAGEIGGVRLDEVRTNQLPIRERGKFGKEYDIIAVNGGDVFVGEIKHKLTEAKVQTFAKKKLPHFARNFPATARGKKIIGMVGGAVVEEDAAKAALKLGMFVLRLKNNRKLAVLAPETK